VSASRPPFTVPGSRPWHSDPARAFAANVSQRLAGRELHEIDAHLFALVEEHERRFSEQCLNLYAGTNVPNPRAARLLGSSIGSRPNLGSPGDTYNRGMDAGSEISVVVDTLLGSLFGAAFVETRVPSGSIANQYVYLATCVPGDHVIAFSDAAAGHVTHHAAGAAGLLGLITHDAAWDDATMDVDLHRFAEQVEHLRPRLVIVAGSMCLFPYSVSAVRAIADRVGATVLYDAAHMGGLIAGGRFQAPLAEGAHVMTGSTYKSFGGPPSGMIVTNDASLAERLDAIAYPGFTANFDLAKTAALGLAAIDLHTYGREYADQCITNAQALADALRYEGVDVFAVPGRADHADLRGRPPFTVSQHVAVAAGEYGGGNAAAKVLEQSNILCSSIGLPLAPIAGEANGLRLGTQELTRWGLREPEMTRVARLFADALLVRRDADRIAADVADMKAEFSTVHFVTSETDEP
jgi:glycine hydroxymethyltransferase